MTDGSLTCVLLADRHHGLVEGLRGLLETAFASVFMVADQHSLLEGVKRLRPTVTVVDLSLADGQWIALVKNLKEQAPESKLIVLSLYDEASVASAAIDAGADAFVLKRAAATDMLDAALAVQRGDAYVSPAVGPLGTALLARQAEKKPSREAN